MTGRDELTGRVDELLRRCVECGLCLPHCATYLETGSEVQSPRGRLTLLGRILENQQGAEEAGAGPDADPPRAFLEAFDLCIGCRACEAVCPGGVPFSLLERGQDLARTHLPRGPADGRALPGLGFVLPRLESPAFLKTVGTAAAAVRGLAELAVGTAWRRRLEGTMAADLARAVGSLPRTEASDQKLTLLLQQKCRDREPEELADPDPPAGSRPRSTPPAEVVFFAGCASAGLLGAASRRLRDLLEASGCRVHMVAGQACCGALAAHTGRPGRAASLRRQNRRAFLPHLADDVQVLVEAAGCGLELKQKYGDDFAARVIDAAVLLDGLTLPPLGRVPLKVAYHDPCHALHGQGISAEPRRLLRRIPGLQLVEPVEPDVCCGSGGVWGLEHPDLSARLGRRKAANLAATGADLVVTGNPGCLGQIADGLALEAPHLGILPLSDLLWFAWRQGAVPA